MVGDRAVQIQPVVDTGVDRRDHPRTAVDREADVARERLVENAVDGHAVVVRALGQAADLGAVGRDDLHRPRVEGPATPGERIFRRLCESTGMATDRVRIGIVGTGNIATLNVPGYLEHEQCDVVAVCDPRPDVLERRMAEWGVERGYTKLEELLGDDDIDAVEILSPTPLHAEHTIAALRAGKHVSCQKPIANDVGDARRMMEVARETGRVFRVTEQSCHYPPLRKARDLIRDGAIGTPTVVRIKTVVGRTESRFQANLDPAGYSWRFNSESPGGHLFDDVMHKYAMALWLVDTDIRTVQSVVRQGPLFFEAPTVALFEYAPRRPARHDGGLLRPRHVHP